MGTLFPRNISVPTKIHYRSSLDFWLIHGGFPDNTIAHVRYYSPCGYKIIGGRHVYLDNFEETRVFVGVVNVEYDTIL